MKKEADFVAEFKLPCIEDEILGHLNQAVQRVSADCPECKKWWEECGGREAFINLFCFGREITQRHAEYILRILRLSKKFPEVSRQLSQRLADYNKSRFGSKRVRKSYELVREAPASFVKKIALG